MSRMKLWPAFSVAPMMDWTDRHCRVFLRLFSPRALLYSEMVTAAAVCRGDPVRLLAFSAEEEPVALQLGGSDPAELAAAARAGEDHGYREINLNCGCPSDRVSAGSFGACLMQEPARVADCVAAMRHAVRLPVTVKMRIGVVERRREEAGGMVAAMRRFDDDDMRHLQDFTAGILAAGCDGIIVHARKAVLGGLSPHENRTVPPLRFDVARSLREAFPQVPFAVNGGLRDASSVRAALAWCDSAMIGREAYHRPALLAELQRACYPEDDWQPPTVDAVLEHMARYADGVRHHGQRLSNITRHMLGLVTHTAGARDYRRLLTEGARDASAGRELLDAARRLLAGAPGAGNA
ncbi:MAG: tRNA dihydrouridine(20/20a) synthase DusA [Pseudomonadota bacterium]